MKKNVFIMLIALFSILSLNEAKAQCGTGWTYFEVPLYYPSCQPLVAKICVKCGSSTVELNIIGFKNVCNPAYMSDYVDFTQAFIKANYNMFCNTIKACTIGTINVIIRKPMCFYIDPDDQSHLLFCNASYCVSTYSLCFDGPLAIWTQIGPAYQQGTPCPFQEYYPGIPANACFKTTANCN